MHTINILLLLFLDVVVGGVGFRNAGIPAQQNGGVCKTKVTNEPTRKSDIPCVFPFVFKGVIYTGCTTAGDPNATFWCSTKVDEEYHHVQGEGEFGYCQENCFKDSLGQRKKSAECRMLKVEDSFSNYSTGVYSALEETVVAWAPHLPVWKREGDSNLYIFWLSNAAGWVIGQEEGLKDGVHFYQSGTNVDSPWKVETWSKGKISVKCSHKLELDISTETIHLDLRPDTKRVPIQQDINTTTRTIIIEDQQFDPAQIWTQFTNQKSTKSKVGNNENTKLTTEVQTVCRTKQTRNTQMKSNAPCQFPFRYKNVTYMGCTSDEDHNNKPWCSTKVDAESNHVARQGEYGHCREDCPTHSLGIVDPEDKICKEGEVCRRRDDCPKIKKRIQKLLGTSTTGKLVKQEIRKIKDLVCNQRVKAFCCPPN